MMDRGTTIVEAVLEKREARLIFTYAWFVAFLATTPAQLHLSENLLSFLAKLVLAKTTRAASLDDEEK